MNKNIESLKKYYINATKEEIIEDMFKDYCNLQQRIDKAIEYIEEHSRLEPPYYEFREFYNKANLTELLSILKGENNE